MTNIATDDAVTATSSVAQLVVEDDQADYINMQVRWPHGMSCRPWIVRSDYLQHYRRNNDERT